MNEEELLRGGRRRKLSEVRAKISYHLSHEMRLSMAEIAGQVGVWASAVAKAARRLETENEK